MFVTIININFPFLPHLTVIFQVTPTIGGFKWHPNCLESFRTCSADDGSQTSTPVNPFEIDKARVERNLRAKQMFEQKAASRKLEKNEVLVRARARCFDIRTVKKKEEELISQTSSQVQALQIEQVSRSLKEATLILDTAAVVTPTEVPKSVMFADSEETEEVSHTKIPELSSLEPPVYPSSLSRDPPALPAFESVVLSTNIPDIPQAAMKPSRRPTISNECRGLLWKQVRLIY